MALSDQQEDLIIEEIINGLGVEDIAIEHSMNVVDIRRFVASLREDGLIKMILNYGVET